MTATIQAIFEDGVLRPLSPLDLNEGQTVQILIEDKEAVAPKNAAAILAEIASLPVENGSLRDGALESTVDSRKAEEMSAEELEAFLDELSDGLDDVPPLSDFAVTREGIYEGL